MHWIAQGRLDGLWFKQSDLTDSAELARLNNRVGEERAAWGSQPSHE